MGYDPFAGAPTVPPTYKTKDRLPAAGAQMFGRVVSIGASSDNFQGSPKDQGYVLTLDLCNMEIAESGKPSFNATGERVRVYLNWKEEEKMRMLLEDRGVFVHDVFAMKHDGNDEKGYAQFIINTLPGPNTNAPSFRIAPPHLKKMTKEEREEAKSATDAAKAREFGGYAKPTANAESNGGFGSDAFRKPAPVAPGTPPEVIDLDKLDDNEFF